MLNKCASVGTGQGSNDDYKHLIQVNARKLNLFALHEKFLSKQEKFIRICLFLGQLAVKKAFDPSLFGLRWQFFAWFHSKINFKFLFISFQIYTEWANYYLERHKSKRKVVDLSVDARDGLLLAEIIEAVTNFKVPDLIKKPKSQQQMVSHSLQSIKSFFSILLIVK